MKTLLKLFLVMGMVFSFAFASHAIAEEVNVENIGDNALVVDDGSSTATEAINAVVNEVTNNPEPIEGVSVGTTTSVPSGFGLFLQGLKEDLSVLFTFNGVAKAEKRIAFAQKRIEQANLILSNSPDAAEQEKAQKIIEKANQMIKKAQAKKEFFEDKTDEKKAKILENLAKLELNSQRVLDKMEDKSDPEQLMKIEEMKVKIDERQAKFFENFMNNPNVPDDVKAKMAELKTEIATKQAERTAEREANKALIEKAKSGDEAATTELKAKKEAKIEADKKTVEALQAKEQEIIETVKTGGVSDIRDIEGIDSDILEKLEEEAQGLEKAKAQAEKAVEEDKPGAETRIQKIEDLQKKVEEKQTEVKKKIEEQRQESK